MIRMFLSLMSQRAGSTLMSSHMFEEIERTSDNVLIIRDGRIVEKSDVKSLKDVQRKGFTIKARDISRATRILKSAGFEPSRSSFDSIDVFVSGDSVDRLIKAAAQFDVVGFEMKSQTLEDVFMQYYGTEGIR